MFWNENIIELSVLHVYKTMLLRLGVMWHFTNESYLFRFLHEYFQEYTI